MRRSSASTRTGRRDGRVRSMARGVILLWLGLVLSSSHPAFHGASDLIIGAPGTGATHARSHARAASLGLAHYDLVFIGRIRSITADSAGPRYPAVCGPMSFAVEHVLRGYAGDSLVTFSVASELDRKWFVPGTQVVAARVRGQGIPLWNQEGFVWVVGKKGALVFPAYDEDPKQRGPRLRLSDLRPALVNDASVADLLRGAAGIAILTLPRAHVGQAVVGPYRCDSVSWVVPADSPLPTWVRLSADCAYVDGRRILVPVPRGFRGDTLLFRGCPRTLRV